MSNETKLVIGMPAGSLANPERGGNLVHLLKAAGFPSRGYQDGGPTSFPWHTMLMGWDGRPQEFGAQLALDEIDVAFAGDDWIRERQLEFQYEYKREIPLERIQGLGRGSVRIVVICNPFHGGFDAWMEQLLKTKPLITMISEMPYLAVDWFLKKAASLGHGDTHNQYAVQKYKTPPRIERGVVVYESWGKTEAKVVHHGVDLGVEITQSGSAIRNYGLAIGEEIMHSETAIWASPGMKQNAEKHELARMLLLNLYGAIFAENKVLMFFNAKKDDSEAVLKYLGDNNLFADEPTMNQGPNYTEFSVQMDTRDPKLPIAKVRYELARLGATHIETVPLDSCIPGIGAVDF